MINPILFGLHEACPFSFLGINWGALDPKDMDCDSFVASSHKLFCGPKETGILYVKKTHAKKTWPNTFGYIGHIVVERTFQKRAVLKPSVSATMWPYPLYWLRLRSIRPLASKMSTIVSYIWLIA